MRSGGSKRNQSGLTIVEVAVVLGIAAVLAVFVAALASSVTSGQRVEQAFTEIQMLKTAAETYRRSPAQRGAFTNITIQRLSDRGYNVEPFTSGVNQNAFGMTIAIVPTAGGADAEITYELDNPEDCLQLVDRWSNIAGVKGTPACASNELTVELE